MRIEPTSETWQVISQRLEDLLRKDRLSLESAQDRAVITLQARIQLLKQLLDLPNVIRPEAGPPLGFESKYRG